MTKAIEAGMPKLRIEETAARRQARIDRGEDVIVGVNKFKLPEEPEIDTREIDNKAVRESQVARLKQIRATRDAKKVAAALEALTNAAPNGQGNLLALGIEAARVRATVGEISDAMEKVWGRYHAEIRSISGVYGQAFDDDNEWKALRGEVDKFAADHGRRPRMLVAKIGQDGHDRGAKVIATAFADLGLRRRRRDAVSDARGGRAPGGRERRARDRHLDAVGWAQDARPSPHRGAQEEDAGDIVVTVGGIIPSKDYKMLEAAGVKAIFGPGTQIPKAARRVLGLIAG